MKWQKFLFVIVLSTYALIASASEIEFTMGICSQNLENFGSHPEYKSKISHDLKTKLLIERFSKGNCDLIAVQEILAVNQSKALKTLQNFAHKLSESSNRKYEAVVGPSNDKIRFLGFLVSKRKFRIVSTKSYSDLTLPEISPDGKPRNFSRGPFEVGIEAANGRQHRYFNRFYAVNFHFKSKHSAAFDPAKLSYEVDRLESAEALRTAVLKNHPEELVIFLGDRIVITTMPVQKSWRGV